MGEQIDPGFYASWRKEQEEQDKKRAKPTLPSQFLIEAIEAFNVVMTQAVERIQAQEQQRAQAQQAADVLGDRLRGVEMENTTLRSLLERWAVWTPVATDDQGSFCALCGGEEEQTESPDPFKHTERCPVPPTRAFLAEHPQEEGAAMKGEQQHQWQIVSNLSATKQTPICLTCGLEELDTHWGDSLRALEQHLEQANLHQQKLQRGAGKSRWRCSKRMRRGGKGRPAA